MREALEDLKKYHNIMVQPADKGRVTVIMNTTDYKTKCLDLLSDSKPYKKLKKDPTNVYHTQLINMLKYLKSC